jgi:Cu(I)/Ag(I) efflux system membrane protein CusA/SilA
MIASIIQWSAKNRFIVFLLVVFLSIWGYYSLRQIPLDAIPDLSDTQVIIYAEWAGRSPDIIEDQVTYPISSTLLASPKVKAVRGFSFLGSSFVYVIFQEGTDIYWARSRVLESLQSVRSKIPADVNPVLGPDATSLGWGFSYALVDETNSYDLAELRGLQDYHLKLALESVEGVAQVASIGGFVKQYQVTIDPLKLRAYNLPLNTVMEAIRRSNRDAEGRVMEFSGTEYMVRGRGYIKVKADIEEIAVGASPTGTPVKIRDIATVQLGPDIRRGVADLDGRGEVVGGIVVVRFGENVLTVIERVKDKIERELRHTLPKGVQLVTTYDRTDLIHRSIKTLKDEIIKLSIAVSVVCLVFLFHLPSALVVILTLPVAILISFICMYYLGVTSNIMSLSGIAIAIGAMVDASIIMVENAHKRLEEWERAGRPTDRVSVIVDAAKEVGPSLFFSLLVITVAFLPVFALQAQAGRLFKPLAYTKTFAMLFASFLAITLTPTLMTLLIRGKVISEEKNPLSWLLHRLYEPIVLFVLRFRKTTITVAILILAGTAYPFMKLGSEFMPPLYEGSLFYMPVTAPGISVTEASRLLNLQDRLIMKVPEVAQVFGKAGRAETATDPAPLEMFETVINLKPESEWRPGVTVNDIKNDLAEVLSIPGVANSFTMPIKARIDMLATGIRTPLGIKVLGTDIYEIERIGIELESKLKEVSGTRSVYAERIATGYFLDIKIKRDTIARYGLNIEDVQEVIQSAIGGMNLTWTVEGRQRYPVNVRYMRDFRSDIEGLRQIMVTAMFGMNVVQIPLGQLAEFEIVSGPTMIKGEEGLLTAYIYIDIADRDVGSYVEEAKRAIASVKVPAGYRLQWSGEYEFIKATEERLKIVIPLTVFLIFVLIYLNTKSVVSTAIVLLAVPFSLVGSFWLLYMLNYNMSIAVWVGLIALAGLDAETGVVMLLYLELAYKKSIQEERLKSREDLKEAILQGAVKRIRPKIMTVSVILAGLIPIMFSTGAGSDVMQRIAAPMIGGVFTSAILELLIYPAIFYIWKGRALKQ